MTFVAISLLLNTSLGILNTERNMWDVANMEEHDTSLCPSGFLWVVEELNWCETD